LACALWWVNFAFAASAIRGALRAAPVAIELIRPVLPYGHLGFIGGIIAIAAGIGEVVADPLAHLPIDTAGLICGGASLYLATFGYTRWRMLHTVSRYRLGAAITCLALLPATSRMPGLACLAALLVVTVALNAAEARTVRRTGRSAPRRVTG
jgi:low temperature requirement protein LtrA